MDDRITLYSVIEEDQNVLIELYFDDDGRLIFDGYDIEKIIHENCDSSPYEYTYTINHEEVAKLFRVMNVIGSDRNELMKKLKELFGNNKAFCLIREFMEKHKIDYSMYSWT